MFDVRLWSGCPCHIRIIFNHGSRVSHFMPGLIISPQMSILNCHKLLHLIKPNTTCDDHRSVVLNNVFFCRILVLVRGNKIGKDTNCILLQPDVHVTIHPDNAGGGKRKLESAPASPQQPCPIHYHMAHPIRLNILRQNSYNFHFKNDICHCVF